MYALKGFLLSETVYMLFVCKGKCEIYSWNGCWRASAFFSCFICLLFGLGCIALSKSCAWFISEC